MDEQMDPLLDLSFHKVTQVINKYFEHKIVNIFLPISLNICLDAQKIHLIETDLLNTPVTYVLFEKHSSCSNLHTCRFHGFKILYFIY